MLVIPVSIFRKLKWKIKNEDNWLALKVFIRLKIELVYSIWKPVIWIYNFSKFLNVPRSSRNEKYDSYGEKGIPMSVDSIFIFWEYMLSKISGFLFLWLRWMAVFLYFIIIIKYAKRQRRLSQRGHKYRYFKDFTLTLFPVKYVFWKLLWNGLLKNSSSIQSKTQNSLTMCYIYYPPRILQNMFFPCL